MDAMSVIEFVGHRLGTKNWVVAKRTTRIRVQYGEDVVCITQAKFRELKAEHAREFSHAA
jgi:hypothetical protein